MNFFLKILKFSNMIKGILFQSLGRSEKINDYIRHGANEGSVELHL